MVEALDLQVSVQVAVAQRPDRDGERAPRRVRVVREVLGAVDHGVGADLVGAGELEEGVGGAEPVLAVELLPQELELEVILAGAQLL